MDRGAGRETDIWRDRKRDQQAHRRTDIQTGGEIDRRIDRDTER